MYTKKSLIAENNYGYDREHILHQSDVDKANMFVDLFKRTRSNTEPKPGDVVRYTNEYGEYYKSAQIEKDNWGVGNLCVAGTSSISLDENGELNFSTSGGAFYHVDTSKMKYLGKAKNTFWFWGHCGARANGGVYMRAEVNLWEYVDPNWTFTNSNGNLVTTKDYDKCYVTKVSDEWKERNNSRYTYLIDCYCTSGRKTAFETEEDYQAWLKTYRGFYEREITDENNGIVWLMKEEQHQVSPDEFDSLNLPEDTFLMNGKIRRCKRKYDTENHKVYMYYVWYWGEFSTRDHDKQNKIIDSYTYDWRDKKEYELARKEIA